MAEKPKLLRGLEAQALIEGDEFVRKYFHTGKLVFAVSWIQPGQRSALDPGHVGAEEVCFVASGRIALAFPDQDLVYEMEAGDGVLIPDSVAHEMVGLGDVAATVVWSAAPGLGRDEIGIGGGS